MAASVLLDFVQNELKERGNTITGFIDGSKLYNRSSFYKIMSQPEKMSEEDIERLSDALGLRGDRQKDLRRLVGKLKLGGSADARARVQKEFYEPKYFFISYKREDIPGVKPADFEIFSDDAKKNRTLKNIYELIDEIDLTRAEDIVIRVQNCVADGPMATLCELISKLRTAIDDLRNRPKSPSRASARRNAESEAPQIPNVSVEHLLTFAFPNDESKTEFMLRLTDLVQFRKYSILYDKYDSTFTDYGTLKNSVLIRVKYRLAKNEKENKKKYFVFHFTLLEGHRGECYITEERSVYSFQRALYDDEKNAHGKCEASPQSGMDANAALARLPFYHRLLVNNEPCLDNMPPEIMRETLDAAWKSQPDQLAKVRALFESEEHRTPFSDYEFIKFQLDYLEQRFKANSENASVNVYRTQSFIEFLHSGKAQELKGHLGFSREQMRRFILYLMKEISDNYGNIKKQQFYFFKKENNPPENKVYSIFDGYGFNVVCLSRDDEEDLNIFIEDNKVGKLLYDSLLENLDDKVMSKEVSLVMLKTTYMDIGGDEQDIKDALGYLPTLSEPARGIN